MTAADYTSEYVHRFPRPEQLPPFWVTLAGVTHRGDIRSSGDTAIEYVLRGSGTLLVDQTEYALEPGDLCILGENVSCSSQADGENPWTKLVIHLAGSAAYPLVQAFGLGAAPVYKDHPQMQSVMEEIIDCAGQDAPQEQTMAQCGMLVMKLLMSLCRKERQDLTVPDDVRTVKRFIDNNYQKNLSMDDIAASVFRSNDYIQKQFKQVYGMTPYGYYMELKLRCAKSLLQQTNLSIGQIADRLGYKSDRYFSARFRKNVGVTAMAYRKNYRKNKTNDE